MKLKQRLVVLCAVLLLLGLAKIFLLDGGEGSAASRRDLRAFRKVSVPVGSPSSALFKEHILKLEPNPYDIFRASTGTDIRYWPILIFHSGPSNEVIRYLDM